LYDRILIELNSPLGSTLKRSSSASAMGHTRKSVWPWAMSALPRWTDITEQDREVR